jgi:hypothetical protein
MFLATRINGLGMTDIDSFSHCLPSHQATKGNGIEFMKGIKYAML